MKRSLRIFWSIALMFFITGCGGYKVVGYSLPEVAPDPAQENGKAEVKVGDQVRLNLVDGSRTEGKVSLVSPHEIVLNHQGESIQPRGYSAEQIQSIESKPGSASTATTAIVVGGLVLVVVGGLILSSEMSNLNSMWD